MKHRMLSLLPEMLAVVVIALFSVTSCGMPASVAGRSTANLTAPGVAALHKKEVVKALDLIRDTAVDGEAAHVVAPAATRIVVKWHKSALSVIDASATGWQDAVLSGLDQLSDDLPAAQRATFSPYISAAKTLFQAVIQ